MNTDTRRALPELSTARIDDIENALFVDIARDRRTRRTRRRWVWTGAGAAAAIIVVAAVIAPSLTGLIGMSGTSGSDQSAVAPDTGFAPEAADGGGVSGESSADSGSSLAPDASTTSGRDIITSASATLLVEDLAVAARTIGNSAVAHGGYVESMNVDAAASAAEVDPSTGVAYDIAPYPYPGGTWITVRVPADELTPLIAELSDVGEVTSSSISRQDVTEQTIDLQARIDAAQASVDRLTELMAQATSVADLIAAESALSERQATLESYQQQLKSLEGLVEMSSLSVTLTPRTQTVEADPAGFGDGLAAGWNGLVATLNGIVIAIGFLLPWIAVVGVIGLIVWGIVRVARRPKAERPAPKE